MERDNGIEADAFVFLGTVSSNRSDELLDDLAAEGIAAYAVSGEPDERLYVDRHSAGYAKALLRRSGGAVDDTDETHDAADDDDDTADAETDDADAAWERIVADLERADGDEETDAETTHPWPEAEDLADDERDGSEEPDSGDADDAKKERRTVGTRGAKVSVVQLDTEDDDEDVDDDDHYVKPDPPSLPKGDLWTKLAWVVMLAALAYPITGLVLDWTMPGWSIALAVTAFVAGIVTHVVRLRDPSSDTDSDDGAVV